jgi:membrane protease YdiL (CAAX protease family)
MVAEPAWRRWVRTYPVVTFFLVAYVFSWSVWLLAVPVAAGAGPGARAAVHYLGLCGPTVAAVILSAWLHGRRGVGELLGRIARWRVGVGWYLFALLSTLAIGLAAVGLHALVRGTRPPFDFSFVAAQLILPAGLPEEFGWRGFALPHLMKKRGAVAASLVIALFWVLWHPPISPALRNPPVLVLFLIEVSALSILFSWLYINSGGSVLLVVLYHFVANHMVRMLSIPAAPTVWLTYVVLLWVVAGVVIFRYGGASLTRLASARAAIGPAERAPGA